MANPPATSSPFQVGAFGRDDNYVPITQNGIVAVKSISLTGSGTTVAVPLFSVTGSVLINSLVGVVTTALGNNTAAYWRLNDQTTQSSITLSTGTALTSAPVGSVIVKNALAASALTLLSSSQERVSEPASAEGNYFSPFVAVQKTGSVETDIEFVYTTSDTPTTGAITFYVGWIPLSSGSRIVAL